MPPIRPGLLDEVRAWQSCPLGAVYPILYLDALQVKVKSQGRVSNKAIYLAFGVNLHGLKGFPEAIEAVYPQTQVQLCMART